MIIVVVNLVLDMVIVVLLIWTIAYLGTILKKVKSVECLTIRILRDFHGIDNNNVSDEIRRELIRDAKRDSRKQTEFNV